MGLQIAFFIAQTLQDKDSYFAYGPVWGLVFILLSAIGYAFYVVRIEVVKPLVQSRVDRDNRTASSFEMMAESHRKMSGEIEQQTDLLRKIATNTEHTPELRVQVAELVKKSQPHTSQFAVQPTL